MTTDHFPERLKTYTDVLHPTFKTDNKYTDKLNYSEHDEQIGIVFLVILYSLGGEERRQHKREVVNDYGADEDGIVI